MRGKRAIVWLLFAEDDFEAAEILCREGKLHIALYHLQQAVEKSLKAVIVAKGIGALRRTHRIDVLLNILREQGVEIPYSVELAEILTDYAFSTRYPDDYVPVSKEEYEEAYEIAKKVLEWAKSIVQP